MWLQSRNCDELLHWRLAAVLLLGKMVPARQKVNTEKCFLLRRPSVKLFTTDSKTISLRVMYDVGGRFSPIYIHATAGI